MSACGRVTPELTDVLIDEPPIADRSCTDVKARVGTATDGVYSIDPDLEGARYKPFEVFCGAMATTTPKEYLELKRTTQPSDESSSNHATYATSAPHGLCNCDCGVITILFSKIRINPDTLVVDIDDRTFSVLANSTQLACLQSHLGCAGFDPRYAVATSCVRANDTSGTANVDLRDMGFHVAGTGITMFTADGYMASGTATIDAERKQLSLTGGGDSGWFGALSGLQLAQDFVLR